MSTLISSITQISKSKWYIRLFVRSLITITLVYISAYFRFTGINWDDFQHLHPDERFLTMVASSIRPVDGGWEAYFDSSTSTLNPYNHGFSFFVYGTAPLFLVRYLAEWINDFGVHLTSLWFGLEIELGNGYDEIHLVGRIVSAIADIISGLLLYLIGKLLYGRRVGLIAAVLYAGTVALVQQAHFFTVDSIATLFATAAILFAARMTKYDRIYNYMVFGALVGAAAASRINLISLIVLMPISVFCNYMNKKPKITIRSWVLLMCSRIMLVGIGIFLVFRILQPYAFVGPSVLDVAPNMQWVDNMLEIRGQMSGDVDFPPNHQWTNRKPLIFPWINMVRWGMGPALGVTAWLGFFLAFSQIIRQKSGWIFHVLPVVWSAIYFLWQGTQWVKPIRYFLPIYPTLILLAAWVLSECLEANLDRYRFRFNFVSNALFVCGRYIIVIGVVLGTLLYAFAFTRIYTRPITRVSASEWIYENVPGPFSIVIEGVDETIVQPLTMPDGFRYEDDSEHSVEFVPKISGSISKVEIGHLGDVDNDEGLEIFRVALAEANNKRIVLGESTITGDFTSNSGRTVKFETPVYVKKGGPYEIISNVISGGPVTITGAQLVNESSWDDGLPLRMNGYDGYGGIYVGHNLELYWNDNESKREHIIKTLDLGDYVLISSNRQYDSISRLPKRYPLTVAYYNALVSGELDYEIVAEFDSSPNLGHWIMSDQDAEEPFTVYDHPKVYIFEKMPSFSISKVRTILERVDLESIIWMTPKQATQAPNALMLDSEILSAQRTGGTWSQMFDRSNLINSNEIVGVLTWWMFFILAGGIMFPLTFLAFENLADRGYAIARIISLLVVSWLAWLLASLRWLEFTRGTIAGLFVLLSVISCLIGVTQNKKILSWIRENKQYVLKVELIWLALFVFDLLIRRANPDLWHPVYGGEKPMDFSYFNAVIKSTYFPPYDPWFSGGYINYYYFGYVLAAIPTKLLGIVPAISYNMLIPTLLAMTGVGAFCVSYNLTIQINIMEKWKSRLSPSLAGLAAAFLMVIMGNLGQPETIYKGISRVIDNNSSELLVGEYQVPHFIRGVYEVLINNNMIPIGTGEWYWNATRIIPHLGNESGPITEFPFFTFLYGDLHAHMLALPVTLAAIAWSIAVVFGARRTRSVTASVVHWSFGAIVIGSLAAINTWDYPTYLFIGCCAILWPYFITRDNNENVRLIDCIGNVCLFVILATLCFLPYSIWYGSSYTKLQIWHGSKTPIMAYFQVHGLFLFLVVGLLVGETRDWVRNRYNNLLSYRNRSVDILFLGGLIPAMIIGLVLFISGVVIAPVVLAIVVWSIALMVIPDQSVAKRICFGLTSVGLLLSLFVEFIRLDGDIGRMNTVFKFYLQIWTLFSVVAGVALAWLIGQINNWNKISRIVWSGSLLALILASISYAFLAIPAKSRDRMAIANPAGLDGMEFMRYANYHDQGQLISLNADYDAIRWMQDNVKGSPVIVEANTPEYRFGSRYSIYTGLPGVIGWNWHQRQQRAAAPSNLVTDRVEEVKEFYLNVDIDKTVTFLDRYAVRYIVVGEYEIAYYHVDGMDKFRQMVGMGLLDIAYENDSVVIYSYNKNMSDVRID